ncbi:MAG: galactokinase [Gemmatimonadota bacterium]
MRKSAEAIDGLDFRAVFGATPTLIVRAPGRVNLVGDHIDYADLAVLPMAIDRGITLTCRPRPHARVRIVNADPRYGEREFGLGDPILPYAAGDWGNYAKAALHGLAELGVATRGFDALVESDLPPAAGLSSSSAMVVAVALAALEVAGESDRFSATGLAGHLADAERYVGVRGGGMDQAAILGGQPGHALWVGFAPLRIRPIAVPSGWTFIVAFSLEAAEKSGLARAAYNERRANVEEASSRVAAALGLSGPSASCKAMAAGRSPAELLEAAARLPGRLGPRFRHVVTESARVSAAASALESGALGAFGSAMLASHASLRDDFEVSTAALDELVDLAMEAGAAGARLTGAGLGGCIVALVPAAGAADVLSLLRERFYAPCGVVDGPRLPFIASASGPAAARTV